MLLTLAFRHLLVRRVRALVLLLGFSLGVGVMIVLLSVGEAMLEQSRDVSLVGGGEVTVLPQGIDVEAMRTGGLGGMFFGIDRARFLTRQLLGGPRQAERVAAVAPAIEQKLIYLRHGGRTVAVRAGGEIPSRARAVGSGIDVRAGRWDDSADDSTWIAPTTQQLYDGLDRFHLPERRDSTWAEWHYFNVVVSPDEWWYITYLIGGEVPDGRWGGQLLVTRRRPDGTYERFDERIPAERVRFDTTRADLVLGASHVRQRDGRYFLTTRSPRARLAIDLELQPLPNRYFPPVELRDDDFRSGYVVPALAANASGTLCAAGTCRRVDGVSAYHDHNWGVWRDVTWEWGTARGDRLSLLYGGVYGPEPSRGNAPFFFTVVDSLGVRQVLRFDRIDYRGERPAGASAAPAEFTLIAARDADTVRLRVDVTDALGTRMESSGFRRNFIQMRGRFRLDGRIAGVAVADSGMGFFEAYVE